MKQKVRLCKFGISIIMVLLLNLDAFAQQTVHGILKSPTGEPLSGVTVTVKGTTKSVATDSKGAFSIDAPPGSTLVISSVGYKTKEIVAGPESVNETLEIAEGSLNEVVLIGYQSVRKRDLTGAVSVVRAQDVT